MPVPTNRATGKPVAQRGDQTAVQAQALEAKKEEAAKVAAAKAEALAEVDSFKKKNVVIDYFADADKPVDDVVEDEVASTLPFREVTMKYTIDQMTYGMQIVSPAVYEKDEEGNDTRVLAEPAQVGGPRYYSFEEGRKYRLPRELADHLDERGYVFH